MLDFDLGCFETTVQAKSQEQGVKAGWQKAPTRLGHILVSRQLILVDIELAPGVISLVRRS
jgi:hypothetical protein